MKRLHLRVPAELHARLTEQARRDGRSLGDVVATILDAEVNDDSPARRDDRDPTRHRD